MIVNTELYRTFYTVAQEGSISKAAEILYITQPAVSRAIHQLEDKSGCSLFFRTPKGVKLTNEGALLYQYIEQAFNFINLGEKKLLEVKELNSGEIRIGVGDTICKHYLLPHLKDFNKAYPNIHIRIANHSSPVMMDLLKNGKIDLAIVNLPIDGKEFNIHKIMKVQDCFVVGNKYKELSSCPRSIFEIVEYPMLLLEKGSNSRTYIDKYMANNDIHIKPEIELGNFELITQFAIIDFGVACVIKNFIQNELENSLLYEIEMLEPIPPRHIGIIHLNSVPLSAASKKFLSILMDEKT